MRIMRLSRFVEIENEFLKSKEASIELVVELLKKLQSSPPEREVYTVAGLRSLPSSSRVKRKYKDSGKSKKGMIVDFKIAQMKALREAMEEDN